MSADISLTVEISPGTSWDEACAATLALANKIQVVVCFNFNETDMFAVPGDSLKSMNLRWDATRRPYGDSREVIKTLRDILGKAGGTMFGKDHQPWPNWDAIAQECYRQMEWTRRQSMLERDWQAIMRQACIAEESQGSVILAPHGWKP